MIVHFFAVRLRHDRGCITIHTSATSALQAAQQVCAFEGAPPSAVMTVTQTFFDGTPLPVGG